MANERLTVKNFGPIREADLDLRKVTVLIGEQASGKSTLAKLVAICANYTAVQYRWLSKDELKNYSIDRYLQKDSQFEINSDYFLTGYKNGEFFRVVNNGDYESIISRLEESRNRYFETIQTGTSLTDNEKEEKRLQRTFWSEEVRTSLNQIRAVFFETWYVPAERIIASAVESLYNAHEMHEKNIFDSTIVFRDKFNAFKSSSNGRFFPPLNSTFESDGRNDVIEYKEVRLQFGESASGFQSAIPIMVIVEGALKSQNKSIFIIEEPELNLYPTTQKKLVEYLIEKCTQGDNRLIITTHSPYILTALNNCIEASNVRKLHPESEAEVDKLVPRQYQIDYEDVMAYFVADGTAKPIMNEEYQIIDANALDDVSNELGRVFDSLLDLKYQNQE